MFNLKLLIVALSLVIGSANCSAEQSTSRYFMSGSMTKLLSAWTNKPIMVVFWSFECAPCIHELDVLTELRNKHPDLNLVMVSTDGASFTGEVASMLANRGLGSVESWIFAESNTRRLRYEIDPTWYGELPRTYFFDSQHNRSAVSGALTAQQVETWLSSLSGSTDTAKVDSAQKTSLIMY